MIGPFNKTELLLLASALILILAAMYITGAFDDMSIRGRS